MIGRLSVVLAATYYSSALLNILSTEGLLIVLKTIEKNDRFPFGFFVLYKRQFYSYKSQRTNNTFFTFKKRTTIV